MADTEKWKKINKSKDVRPKVQEYSCWEELSPIPISLPIDGAIGITGDWRTFRPIINQEGCNKCGFCWMYCPEGCIFKKDNKFKINYNFCKGCLICVENCPVKAIDVIE